MGKKPEEKAPGGKEEEETLTRAIVSKLKRDDGGYTKHYILSFFSAFSSFAPVTPSSFSTST